METEKSISYISTPNTNRAVTADPKIPYLFEKCAAEKLRQKMCPAKSVAEFGSALGSAACQNLAATLCGHSLAEAMLLLSVTLFGLIGAECRHTLHHPFDKVILNSGKKPQ